MQRKLTRNGTGGRVYGGDEDLIHIADGDRANVGHELAATLSARMRDAAYARGDRTLQEAGEQPICPGCYMVAIYNAAVALARENGQPLDELGATLAGAFQMLAEGDGPERMEHIGVALPAWRSNVQAVAA